MGNILRHTGINLGGLNQVSWVYREDIAGFTYNEATLYCLVTLKPDRTWNLLYGTPETLQLESEEQDMPGGMKYLYKLKVLVPKDRPGVEAELFRMNGRQLVVKLTDKNGTIRILGTMESPMKMTSKLTKPASLETFNGYDLLFAGEFSTPAGFLGDPSAGIPEDQNPF